MTVTYGVHGPEQVHLCKRYRNQMDLGGVCYKGSMYSYLGIETLGAAVTFDLRILLQSEPFGKRLTIWPKIVIFIRFRAFGSFSKKKSK